MKKTFIFLIFLILSLSIIGICFNDNTQKTKLDNASYLRIHIRANSNSQIDQEIKYKIKDEFVVYLTPKLAFCNSKNEVVDLINKEKLNLKNLADDLLKDSGFSYSSNVCIKSEMFPARDYEGLTLESGIYDALIVELGNGTGNNWWCVIYPPLCFNNFSNTNSQNIVYKSKILEIIKKFFS